MLTYFYIASIAIAFLSSLRCVRLDIFHYKVVSAILAIDLIAEIWANLLLYFTLNNIPVYNVNMLLEFWLYAYYYRFVIKNATVKKLIQIYLWTLPVFWIIVVLFIFHIQSWNSLFFLTGCSVMVILSVIYYYQLFTAERLVKLGTSFEFWIATALIIFYACNLPFLGMLNYLNRNFMDLAKKLLVGLQILNIIFYTIISYAFIWGTRIKRSS